MVEWFHERYISRDEHQQVVDYYAKLVAQLYSQVCALRAAQAAARALDDIVEHGTRKAELDIRRSAKTAPDEQGGKIIHVDFRRHS